MGLFGGDTPDLSRRAKTEIWSQFDINRGADAILQQIQQLVSGQFGQPFSVSEAPRAVPPTNALTQAANQNALGFATGQGGLGSAIQGSLIDTLTRSGADLFDQNIIDQFFQQAIAAPAQRDYTRGLNEAANFVSGIGGERSGGFGTILGDLSNEFGQNLLGQRAQLNAQMLQQRIGSEDARLNRIAGGGLQAALAPTALLSQLGQQQFQNQGLQGTEDLNRWLLSQPFSNPYVTTFLNAALGARNPGLVTAAG